MRITVAVVGMLLVMAAFTPASAKRVLDKHAGGVDFNNKLSVDYSAPNENAAFGFWVAANAKNKNKGLHLGWGKGKGPGGAPIDVGSGNPVSATPEPAGVILTASGLLAALYFARRSRRRVA